MENIRIKVEKGVEIPEYATQGSAGFDLKAVKVLKEYSNIPLVTEDGFTIPPQGRILVGTGIFIELPMGKQLEIRSRSGLAVKEGICVLNSPGTIDSDYRGEIGVILYNSSHNHKKIMFGERVAQGVITDYHQTNFTVVTKLSDTNRGEGGFGSTGK